MCACACVCACVRDVVVLLFINTAHGTATRASSRRPALPCCSSVATAAGVIPLGPRRRPHYGRFARTITTETHNNNNNNNRFKMVFGGGFFFFFLPSLLLVRPAKTTPSVFSVSDWARVSDGFAAKTPLSVPGPAAFLDETSRNVVGGAGSTGFIVPPSSFLIIITNGRVVIAACRSNRCDIITIILLCTRQRRKRYFLI